MVCQTCEQMRLHELLQRIGCVLTCIISILAWVHGPSILRMLANASTKCMLYLLARQRHECMHTCKQLIDFPHLHQCVRLRSRSILPILLFCSCFSTQFAQKSHGCECRLSTSFLLYWRLPILFPRHCHGPYLLFSIFHTHTQTLFFSISRSFSISLSLSLSFFLEIPISV
jgi:hypothetical protein